MNDEPHNNYITNKDLMERMEAMEKKMDSISQKMEQATGAWLFIKIIGSITIGMAVIWNAAANYFR